jgi:hypothetical protein
MPRSFKALLLFLLLTFQAAEAEHVIVCGGPALRAWEDYRTEEDRHDRWWANFVRASTIRMDNIRKEQGKAASLVWLVYKPGYVARGREDGKPYTQWIAMQAAKRNATLIWFNSTEDYIRKINARPKRSVETYDFFGHSNKYAFMFDYGSEIMAASTAWLHERDISRLDRAIFTKDAYCKSWGCHTGASMSDVWERHLKTPLIGAKGKTLYTMVGRGELPVGYGGWTR